LYNMSAMAPRSRSEQTPLPPDYIRVSPELEAELREAIAQADRGEARTLTPEELQRMAETGEWPAWCDELD
jgi:hypothetical protein